MNQTEIMALAQDTVDIVLEDMPKGLTPEEEAIYLTNAGRIMGRSCMIMQEMVAVKPKATQH